MLCVLSIRRILAVLCVLSIRRILAPDCGARGAVVATLEALWVLSIRRILGSHPSVIGAMGLALTCRSCRGRLESGDEPGEECSPWSKRFRLVPGCERERESARARERERERRCAHQVLRSRAARHGKTDRRAPFSTPRERVLFIELGMLPPEALPRGPPARGARARARARAR